MHPDPHTRQALARGKQADLLHEAARARQARAPGPAQGHRRPPPLARLVAVLGRRRADPPASAHPGPAKNAST